MQLVAMSNTRNKTQNYVLYFTFAEISSREMTTSVRFYLLYEFLNGILLNPKWTLLR